MPGREAMAVSKAEKGQIQSVPGCAASKGSLMSWEGDHQFGIQVLPQRIQTSPIQVFWCLRCCMWQQTTFTGRCLVQFLRAPVHPLEHSLPDSAATLWHWMTYRPRQGQGWTSQGWTYLPHKEILPGAWGGLSILTACSPPALCTGPGKSSCRYGWVGDSASTEPELFPLPQHPPQRLSLLIKSLTQLMSSDKIAAQGGWSTDSAVLTTPSPI